MLFPNCLSGNEVLQESRSAYSLFFLFQPCLNLCHEFLEVIKFSKDAFRSVISALPSSRGTGF